MVSEYAAGSLLLGTNSALLQQHRHPAKGERTISFSMDQVGWPAGLVLSLLRCSALRCAVQCSSQHSCNSYCKKITPACCPGCPQVQAHIAQRDVDPAAGPQWLEISNGKLTPPKDTVLMRQVGLARSWPWCTSGPPSVGAHMVSDLLLAMFDAALNGSSPACAQAASSQCRRSLNAAVSPPAPCPPLTFSLLSVKVLRPFKAHLISSSLSTAAMAAAAAAAQRAAEAGGPPSTSRAQQELTLEVPEVEGVLDSREFDILVDVLQSVCGGPLPQVGALGAGCAGGWQSWCRLNSMLTHAKLTASTFPNKQAHAVGLCMLAINW